MSEDKKPFTVKDRRHFTSEGAAREADAPAEPVAPVPVAPAAEEAEPPPAEEPEEAARASQDEGPRFPSDFVGLLVTLGTQGSMMLAGVMPGERQAGPPDLDGARDVISLLESLQGKTEGHRTPDEERLLAGILYELRMAYVALRKDARA